VIPSFFLSGQEREKPEPLLFPPLFLRGPALPFYSTTLRRNFSAVPPSHPTALAVRSSFLAKAAPVPKVIPLRAAGGTRGLPRLSFSAKESTVARMLFLLVRSTRTGAPPFPLVAKETRWPQIFLPTRPFSLHNHILFLPPPSIRRVEKGVYPLLLADSFSFPQHGPFFFFPLPLAGKKTATSSFNSVSLLSPFFFPGKQSAVFFSFPLFSLSGRLKQERYGPYPLPSSQECKGYSHLFLLPRITFAKPTFSSS